MIAAPRFARPILPGLSVNPPPREPRPAHHAGLRGSLGPSWADQQAAFWLLAYRRQGVQC